MGCVAGAEACPSYHSSLRSTVPLRLIAVVLGTLISYFQHVVTAGQN